MKTANKLFIGLFAALLLPHAAMAELITLDFDGETGHWITLDNSGIDDPLTEDGFVVEGSGSTNSLGVADAWCGPPCPRNGTPALRVSDSTTIISVLQEDGGLFDVLGFDGAEFFADRALLWATSIRLTGTYAGGNTVSEDFALDFITDGLIGGVEDFETFAVSADFTNLAALSIQGVGNQGYFSLDNLDLEVNVPEPGTLLLFGAGLLGMRLSRRKKTV